MGGFLGLISPLSWFKVRRDTETCIDCKACDKVCTVAVKVSDKANVNSPECINCNDCVNACPVHGALEVKAPNGNRIRPITASLLAIGILAIVAAGTTATGWFGWTTKSLQEEVTNSGGKFDPELIKGKSTFREISEASGIPLSVFKKEFKLSDKDLDAELKTFEERGFDPDAVREFVEEYLKSGEPPAKDETKTPTGETPEADKTIFDTAEIKGSTTVRQTSEMSGVPAAAIQDKFNISDGQLDTPIKDLKGIVGFTELDEFRAYITEYLNTKK
jgi:NAD-dependent dihydropyrimidine dehydrogenase PreA subunit